jgi:hypothetical protein
MSKGPGRVERAILTALAPSSPGSRYRMSYSARYLARQAYRTRPTPAQMSAVRRALRALASDGQVEVDPSPPWRADDSPPPQYRLTQAADGEARRALAEARRQSRRERPRRRRDPQPEVPPSPEVDVTSEAPCPACGQPAKWLHRWDDLVLVACRACGFEGQAAAGSI